MKPFALVTLLAFLAATTVAPAQTAAQGRPNRSSGLTLPVTGTGGGGTFTGTFQLQRFVNSDGAVAASGLLTGTLTTAAGATTTIARNVVLPVQVTQATCDILHLDIGPIALDLLGLRIDLSRIVLDIVAESGPGNLLGNLLCAVANLLNNPSGLANLLNRILDALLG